MDELPPIPAGLIAVLHNARHVAVLTGAGISAESGIPTFRDAQTGLWAKFNPEDLATPDAFRRNPDLVWQWYQSRRAGVLSAKPNPAHLALAELEQRVSQFTLITQNIDPLHRRAGNSNLIELHGQIDRLRCSGPLPHYSAWPATETDSPPLCPECGALLRPDVVWFGEMLSRELLAKAWAAASSADLFFSIGTSGVVEPAASLPRVALQASATIVVINLDVENSAEPPLYTLHS
ncbi:MAG: NAD-dependent deacylase, partial [Oscillochloris sp.]|nr:NAD-dependent deacylase [Oscillochloris sp.]